MPKLPSLTPQKIIKILEKEGFVLDRVKGNPPFFTTWFLFIKEIYRRERCLK